MASDSGIPGHFPHQLAEWWEHGPGAAKIRWGTHGDFDRCVRLAVEEAHMDPERAKGFCNVRHHAVLGIYPATHAAEEKAKRSGPLDMSAAEPILRAFDAAAHPRAAAGSSAGGQFAPSSGGSGSKDARATPSNKHPVGEGEAGHRVGDLQKRLNALGAHLAVDGKFGPKTLAAVRAFQKAHGLKVDGLVGPKTTAALRLKEHPASHHKAPAGHKPAAHAAMAKRSADGGYDEDGLDGSWDGDLSDLPDLTGLGVADFEALDGGGDPGASRMAKVGSGARFRALKSKLAAKGASDPGALAAYIGRKKFGRAKFGALASKARKGKGGGMHRTRYDEWIRPTIPLEDIRIVSRAEGDGSGALVEAYATVFDEPAEIKDGQGHYKEIIDRTAFDHELSRIRRSRGGFAANVKVLYNHGKTMEGLPAPEFQLPLGVPEDIRPETRGLLTRTRFDTDDPFTERVLSKVRAGAITSYSFVGGIMRSAPELESPGHRYRARNGALTTVRRMMLGLREYGPVLFPAYTGAEILGVRMSIPGGVLEDEIDEDVPDTTGDEESVPDMEQDGAAGTREEVHPSREHAHRLLVMRTEQICREAGIGPLKGGF